MDWWDLSCRDWAAKLARGEPPIADLPLFEDEANEALGFFNDLRLPDVHGTPRMGDAAGQWFKDIVRAAFGSWDKKRQIRYINEIFVLAPKGSSKTTYGAALLLTVLLMNTRKRAELLVVAETQSISENAFNSIAGMIEEDSELGARFKAVSYSNKFEIYDQVMGATLHVKTFSLSILTGIKPIMVLLEELHLLGKMSAAEKIIIQIRGGLEKRAEGLMIIISTQSDEPPKGVFEAELTRARAIRDGKQAGRMLPMIYEFPPAIARDETRWQDPANWKMVSPNLGLSLKLPSLISSFEAEKAKGDHAARMWASQHLNLQIGVGGRGDGWAGAQYWERGIVAGLSLDDLLERSDVICGGVDGGGADDLLGLAFIGRDRDTKRWLAWTHAFVTPEGRDRRKANAVDYEHFMADGDLTLVDQMPDDLDQLVDIVSQVKDSGHLYKMGVDGAGLGGIVDALGEIGVTQEAELLEPIRQGMGLMGAIKAVERKLIDGTFKHGGQRMLAWCAGNAKVSLTPTGMRIARDASGYGKIDPLMALLNAADLMATNPQAKEAGRMGDFLKSPLAA